MLINFYFNYEFVYYTVEEALILYEYLDIQKLKSTDILWIDICMFDCLIHSGIHMMIVFW